MGEQVEALEHHADLPAQFAGKPLARSQRDAVNPDHAPFVGFQPVDAADQRGFARSGRTADDDALALADGQIHVPEHLERPEPLADVIKRDNGWGIVRHGSGALDHRLHPGRDPVDRYVDHALSLHGVGELGLVVEFPVLGRPVGLGNGQTGRIVVDAFPVDVPGEGRVGKGGLELAGVAGTVVGVHILPGRFSGV